MLQAHSFLWHYLWVAPNLFLLCLAYLAWRRGLYKSFPVFVVFALVASLEQLMVYAADVLPWVSPATFWDVFWAGLLIEAVIKFALIGEIFGIVFGSYPALARTGRLLIRSVGVILVFLATVAAAYAPKDGLFGIVSGAHILEQTIFMIESGLLLFMFLFAGYFRLAWRSSVFGITLGLSISACVHLATWAVMANGAVSNSGRYVLDFVNMATYHVCVLIWFYYLLIPDRSPARTAVALPENNLAAWNRELERLLQ